MKVKCTKLLSVVGKKYNIYLISEISIDESMFTSLEKR